MRRSGNFLNDPILDLRPSYQVAFSEKEIRGIYLAISSVDQGLRHCIPNSGGPGSIPGQGTRSPLRQLRGSYATAKDPRCCNKDRRPHVPQPRPGIAKINKCLKINK